LGVAVGRLHFAGEATNSKHWGAAHSAIESGWREAIKISGDSTIIPHNCLSLRKPRRVIRKLITQNERSILLKKLITNLHEKITLSPEELQKEMENIDPHHALVSMEECLVLYEELDLNHDGLVEKNELEEALKRLNEMHKIDLRAKVQLRFNKSST